MSRIAVIGGGPAGLALAYDLGHRGHQVTLYEAAPEVGGLAGSFRLGNIEIEKYYHFICGGDEHYKQWIERLGLERCLKWRSTRTGFFYHGTEYPFSTATDLLACKALTLTGRLRVGAFALRCARIPNWKRLDGIPAKDWLIHNLGFDTYHVLWHPLLAIKFHQAHDQISAAWIWHRIHRVATSRKSAMRRESYGFLEGGTQVFIDALTDGMEETGVDIRTSCPVQKIEHGSGRVLGVETESHGLERFEQVVSTAPLPVFGRMVAGLPPQYRKRLDEVDFIGVTCVVLQLREPLSDHYWYNTNDPRIAFNGCIEYTNLNPDMTSDGSKILYVPYYEPPTSDRFRASDETVLEETISGLEVMNADFDRSWIIESRVFRERYAQVVCPVGFGLLYPRHRTPIDGLFLIESSQLYPQDRSISATLELVERVSGMIGDA